MLIPVTIPEVPTDAMLVAEELQVPPGTVLLNTVAPPGHTDAVPVIAPVGGVELTVTAFVAVAAPQLLVAV